MLSCKYGCEILAMMSRSSCNVTRPSLSRSDRPAALNSTSTLKYGQSRLTNVRFSRVERPPSVLKTISSSSRVMPALMVSIFSKTSVTQASCPCEHCSCFAECASRTELEALIEAIEIKTNTRSRRIIFVLSSALSLRFFALWLGQIQKTHINLS
jgi:hypothetical protein